MSIFGSDAADSLTGGDLDDLLIGGGDLDGGSGDDTPVSYTHLTLPTSDLV